MSGICLSTRACGAQIAKNVQLSFPSFERRDELWGARSPRTHAIRHRSRDWRRDAVHLGKFLRFALSSFRLDTSMLVHVRDVGSIESASRVFPVPSLFAL